ncbi:MAG: Rrf2 family transcriptional regulator [Treponema sp.]|nr:Rrf2 family transcriptional regulator [Treponema sp.]
MKLSSRTQFGLKILCYLALRYGTEPVQAAELARVTGTTEKYIGQIMLTLRASPLVLASRGAQGGYYLSRSPEEINLFEALAALEGELLQMEALSGSASLEVLSNALKALQGLVAGRLESTLKGLTLQDLIREGQYHSGYGDWVI